jgi:hypothetical protein
MHHRRLRLWLLALLCLLIGIAFGYWTLHIVWLNPCNLEDKPCLRRLQLGGAAATDATIIALTASLWCVLKALHRPDNPASSANKQRRRP